MLEHYIDYRLGNIPRHYFATKEDKMKVPDEIRKSVIFLLYKDSNQQLKLAGTGFCIVHIVDGIHFAYLVTAKHVIVGVRLKSADGKIIARVNDSTGGILLSEINIDDWVDHPNDSSVDIMVLSINPQANLFDIRFLPTAMIATDEMIKKYSIGAGDDLFITGLFANHYGKKRNIPIVRVGTIAAMPEEKVDTRDFGSIEAYLIEARSMGGLSGSPIFINLDPLRAGSVMFTTQGVQGHITYLLGVMHGHWDRNDTDKDSIVDDMDGGKINVGIGIVVPAIKILEILEHPKFVENRQKVIEKIKQNNLPTQDTL